MLQYEHRRYIDRILIETSKPELLSNYFSVYVYILGNIDKNLLRLRISLYSQSLKITLSTRMYTTTSVLSEFKLSF